MNRTDRLYAVVEELRAVAPRPLSARRLAERFEVSVRTVERDIGALQQAGVPIWAETGRRGGYALDRTTSLPPVNFTWAEATALVVALARAADGAFAVAGRSALLKVLEAMPARDAAVTRALAARVRLVDAVRTAGDDVGPMPRVPPALAAGVASGRCVRLGYTDQHGATSERVLEPLLLLGRPDAWYVLGWCRLRDAARAFRLDRIAEVELLDERVAPRDPESVLPPVPHLEIRAVAV